MSRDQGGRTRAPPRPRRGDITPASVLTLRTRLPGWGTWTRLFLLFMHPPVMAHVARVRVQSPRLPVDENQMFRKTKVM